jgi:hypothetical protein
MNGCYREFLSRACHLPRSGLVSSLIAAGAVVIGTLVYFQPRLFLTRPASHSEVPFREAPLSVAPLVSGLVVLPEQQLALLLNKFEISTEKPVSLSGYLHQLRLHGRNQAVQKTDFSQDALLRGLANGESAKALFHASPVQRTMAGVRFETSDPAAQTVELASETHRDQTLAVLAEMGVPLSQPIKVDGRSFSLRDALRDSVANFHLRQKELAWTAFVYALYLPPQRSWTNRYGETYDFDRLVNELTSQPLARTSCAGTHIAFTLVTLSRVDHQIPILSRPTREKLDAWLRTLVRVVRRHQNPDGSWPLDWSRGFGPSVMPQGWSHDPNDPAGLLLATSHLAELLLYLPPDMQCPAGVVRRAGQWLERELVRASTDEILDQFCPYSHAALVVRQLAVQPEFESPALRSADDCRGTSRFAVVLTKEASQ